MAHSGAQLDLPMVRQPFRRPLMRKPPGQSTAKVVQRVQANKELDELHLCKLLTRVADLRVHRTMVPAPRLDSSRPYPIENHGLWPEPCVLGEAGRTWRQLRRTRNKWLSATSGHRRGYPTPPRDHPRRGGGSLITRGEQHTTGWKRQPKRTL